MGRPSGAVDLRPVATPARVNGIATLPPLLSRRITIYGAVHLAVVLNIRPLCRFPSKDLRFIMTDLNAHLKQFIRDIPDFPIDGIIFRDITTLLAEPRAFHTTIDGLLEPYRNQHVDKVVVIESRGFIFGTPMAYELGAGIVPVRKPGKLPAETLTEEYSLEYGTNILQIHTDAIAPGEKVIIVDDLLATGGTVAASIHLVEQLGGEIIGISFLAELLDLHGRERIPNYTVHSLVQYP